MRLERYLDRIGWSDKTAPTFDILAALLRAHNHNIPFENLDVQMGNSLTTDVEDAYEKLVVRNRGGWCYEQNGVFGWALAQIGFNVQRVAGSVMRGERGAASDSNHLALLVSEPDSSSRWLVDVGFGGSMLTPVPLEEGSYYQAPYHIGLRRLGDGFWQFWERGTGDEFSFDFEDAAGDERAMSVRCDVLQTDPESGFVQNVVCQIRRPSSHLVLRGRVLAAITPDGKQERLVESSDEWVHTVRTEFGLNVPELAGLWGRVCERHEQLSNSTRP